MPSRRTCLAGLGAAFAGLAGCSGRLAPVAESDLGETPSTTPTSEPREWGETVEVADVSITPTNAVVQHTAFHHLTPDTLGVTAFEDQRAVFVTVRTSGGMLNPNAFELTVAGGIEGWVDAPNVQWLRRTAGASYGEDSDGWVGFTTPVLEGEGGHLRVEHEDETAKWELPESVLESLAEPAPEFAVEDVSVPNSVAVDSSFEVSVTARNEGDVSGTFVAALNELGPTYRPHRITMSLDPGASETWEQSFWADEAGTEQRFGFRTVDVEREYSVEVAE